MSDLIPFQSDSATISIKTISLGGNVENAVRGLGWEWCVEEDCATYLSTEAVALPRSQADELLEAADTLYDMFVQAVPEGLPDAFLEELHIPRNLWQAVRLSWEDDRNWHLYGRFDLVQTPEGPKLIEFNADTASAIPETAVVQWASLAADGKKDAEQSSGLYEGLVEQLRHWRELNPDLRASLLLVYAGISAEDRTNCEVIAHAAKEAGFNTFVCPVEEINVSVAEDERGVWAKSRENLWENFSFVFKLVPWEQIAWEEPDLAHMLTDLMAKRDIVIANPAYTLLFQSKAMLARLWKMFPYHPLLVAAGTEKQGGRSVRKPVFGREGQNVQLVFPGGISMGTEGEFSGQAQVHQQFINLPQDAAGNLYQAGVFWAGEACAIGYRREKGIITNLSQFVPHIIV